jgi:hypothetical protein
MLTLLYAIIATYNLKDKAYIFFYVMCTVIKNLNLNFALLYSITASYKKIGFFLMCILIKNINLILVYSIIYHFPSLMCTYFNLKDKTNYFF